MKKKNRRSYPGLCLHIKIKLGKEKNLFLKCICHLITSYVAKLHLQKCIKDQRYGGTDNRFSFSKMFDKQKQFKT